MAYYDVLLSSLIGSSKRMENERIDAEQKLYEIKVHFTKLKFFN